MRKLALFMTLGLALLALAACGAEPATPTAVPPTQAPTATSAPATSTSAPATATEVPPSPTSIPQLPTAAVEPPTSTVEPSPTSEATATVGLAPGGWALVDTSGVAPSPRYDHMAVLDP